MFVFLAINRRSVKRSNQPELSKSKMLKQSKKSPRDKSRDSRAFNTFKPNLRPRKQRLEDEERNMEIKYDDALMKWCSDGTDKHQSQSLDGEDDDFVMLSSPFTTVQAPADPVSIPIPSGKTALRRLSLN